MSGKVYVEQIAQQQLWEKGTALLDVLPVLKEARRLVRARACACFAVYLRIEFMRRSLSRHSFRCFTSVLLSAVRRRG